MISDSPTVMQSIYCAGSKLSGVFHAYVRVCHLSKIMATIALTDDQITRSDFESCVVVQMVAISPRALESDNKQSSTLASKDRWNLTRAHEAHPPSRRQCRTA